MSHLVEEYAKHLGVKISKPIVTKHFLPITFDKYITVCLDHETPSKNYKYYEIVLDFIKQYLEPLDIKVIQIGSSKSSRLNNVDARIFDLNFKNEAYLISKSKLHIGSDNVYSHYASSIDVPLVTVFGNVYANVSRGYWGKNQINIEAPWKVKPSLGAFDRNDSINKIHPETIAAAILKQLSINPQNLLKTRFIGDFYSNKITEIVPNFFSPIEQLKNELVFIRLDYESDVQSFYSWANYLNAYSIFAKDILSTEFCRQFAHKIKNISYIIDKTADIPEEHLQLLQSLNIPFTFLVVDPNELSELRDKFFDYVVQPYFKANKDMLPEDCVNFDNLYFASSKTLLADNAKYESKYHWLKKQKSIDKNSNLEDNEILLEELSHFYVYTRTN